MNRVASCACRAEDIIFEEVSDDSNEGGETKVSAKEVRAEAIERVPTDLDLAPSASAFLEEAAG